MTMAQYVQYRTDDGDAIWIQIEDSEEEPQAGVVKAGRIGEKVQDVVLEAQIRFEDAMDTVKYSAQTILQKIKRLSDPPDEVEVTFGLKATGELGNLAVAKAKMEGNYTVKLTWRRSQKWWTSEGGRDSVCQTME